MVLLVFDPRQTWARLYDYDPADRRVGISLCAAHGDAVSVPAGWTIVDDRSPVPHLASVRPDTVPEIGADTEPEPHTGPDPDPDPHDELDDVRPITAAGGSGSSPTLWSGEEPVADPAAPAAPAAASADAEAAGAVDADDATDERDPGDDLDVDESTPLLSRAFRAAHVD